MEREFIIIVDDGRGEITKVKMSEKRLRQMIADSLWVGALASSAIEGENIEGLEQTPVDLPDRIPDCLLRTEK